MSQHTSKFAKLLAGLALSGLAVGLIFAATQTGKPNLTEADSARPSPSVSATGSASPAAAQLNAQNSDLLKTWVVSATEAKQLIEQGATLLDARGAKGLKGGSTMEGAVVVTWQQFSQPNPPNKGKLLEDDALLSKQLQDIGVSSDQPVVVVADPQQGWGEDGRIVWMLRTLGHQQAVLVDGGYEALVDAGLPTSQQVSAVAPTPGNFVVNRTNQWEIGHDELQATLENQLENRSKNVVIIDVRESREYNGQTPYGEQRGGHVPGAIHLYYKDLLDQEGNLLSREEILAKLADQGVTPDAEIVSYCTAGIRSGWFTSVLTDLGFQAKNYAGSMMEWASATAEQYPLTNQ